MNDLAIWIIGIVLTVLFAVIGYTVRLLISIIKTSLKEQNILLKEVHDKVTIVTTTVNNISTTIKDHSKRLSAVEKTANDTALVCKLEHSNKIKNN